MGVHYEGLVCNLLNLVSPCQLVAVRLDRASEAIAVALCNSIRKGFTYLYLKGVPLYSLGHGLNSTTQIMYSNLTLSQARSNTTEEVHFPFDLPNAGSEVVADVYSSSEVERATADQKPARISLWSAGTGRNKARDDCPAAPRLSYYDPTHKFVVAPGMFNVMIGSSSDDIRLRSNLDARIEWSAFRWFLEKVLGRTKEMFTYG